MPNLTRKVAIFVPSCAVGGAEHYIKNIIELIEDSGYQATLVLPLESKIVNFFSDLKIDYLTANIAWVGDAGDLKADRNYLSKLSTQYREAIKALESLNPDCAFINLPWVDFGLGIALACHSLQIPCINLVHLCPWKVQLNDLTKQLFQELAETNSNFFTVSYDNKIQLSLSTGIDLNLIKVFYNSRDVTSAYTSLTPRQYKFHRLELLDELGLPLNSFLSVSVGRFSHQKNFLDLITSFASIHEQLPNYWHLFLGEGKLKDYYSKIVADLGLSNRILFLGYRKDVDRFLALSDLFISTSLYEGLALSILEAAQFLSPIIATDASSAREIIPSSEYGLLYNPGQYNLLSKYLEFAYFNPDAMKEKALKLKSFCQEKFSLNKFKTDLENILNDSIKNHLNKNSKQISVYYDKQNNLLKTINQSSIALKEYNYNGLPLKESTNQITFPYQKYARQLLQDTHVKYLHALHKISRNFLFDKIILCFGNFHANFFRKHYLKGQYLLLVISKELKELSVLGTTLSLYHIDHTYWGQEIEPDCLANFTAFETYSSLSEITKLDLNYNHFYTSLDNLKSQFNLFAQSLCNINPYLDGILASLVLINQVFKPEKYYIDTTVGKEYADIIIQLFDSINVNDSEIVMLN